MDSRNFVDSFRHAWNGIIHCFRTERNMKIHVAAALTAGALAWRLGFSATETALLVVTIAAVIAAEMLNTAIEAVVDLISPQYHPLAKIAKDLAAGAVLVVALAALFIGYLLFIPHL